MKSEASSKTQGRPAVFSEEMLERAVHSGVAAARHVTTRRGAQDLVYRIRAVAVIEQYRKVYPAEAEPLEWLFSPGDMRGLTWRHSLLTELGRAWRPQVIVAIALRVAAARPSTRDGVRMIRQYRRGVKAASARRSHQGEGDGADNQ